MFTIIVYLSSTESKNIVVASLIFKCFLLDFSIVLYLVFKDKLYKYFEII